MKKPPPKPTAEVKDDDGDKFTNFFANTALKKTPGNPITQKPIAPSQNAKILIAPVTPTVIAPVTPTVTAPPVIAPSVVAVIEDLNDPETNEDENYVTLAYIKNIG